VKRRLNAVNGVSRANVMSAGRNARAGRRSKVKASTTEARSNVSIRHSTSRHRVSPERRSTVSAQYAPARLVITDLSRFVPLFEVSGEFRRLSTFDTKANWNAKNNLAKICYFLAEIGEIFRK